MTTLTQTAVTDRLFAPLTAENAPERSRPVLASIQEGFGFVPNLMATFANSPTVLEGYLAMDAVWEKGTFSPSERQLIFLAASVENGCRYCTAAHSTVAKGMLHVSPEIVAAIREGKTIPDAKIDALSNLTREIVRERGHVSPETIQAFLDAGYKKDQVMELLMGVALKTVSNYLDAIQPAEIDAPFAAEA